MKYKIRQLIKMILQHAYLPLVYFLHKRRRIQKGLVVFADAHHDSLPFSMEMMHKKVSSLDGVRVCDMFFDFQGHGMRSLFKYLNRFMKVYASAEYVFICDNFLPVASCRKRKGTTVIQLWHSGGLLKKAGYDVEDTVPAMYKGNVYANYDLLTVSAPCCVKHIQRSMRQPKGVVRPTGISRTDTYFDERYNSSCIDEFYSMYPEAKGKKIALWVPTFRGTAVNPVLVGEEDIEAAFGGMKDWFLVRKLHPHFENKNKEKITCSIPSERLFAVADVLITDYSSIVFDYLAYKKPFVFFAPDLKEFEEEHGFYVSYDSFPTTVAVDADSIKKAVESEFENRKKEDLEKCYEYHMKMCDGFATERILKTIGLMQSEKGNNEH